MNNNKIITLDDETYNIRKKANIYTASERKTLFQRIRESSFTRPSIAILAGLIGVTGVLAIATPHSYAKDNNADDSQHSEKLTVGGDLRTIFRDLEDTPTYTDKTALEERARLTLDYGVDDFHFVMRGVAEHSTLPAFSHRFLKNGELLFIDRAYAKYSGLTLGASDNTLAGWFDRDIPLVGAQAEYPVKNKLSLDKLAMKIAWHIGQPWLDEANSGFLAVQLEGGKKLAGNLDLSFILNYTDWTELDAGFIRTNAKNGADYASDFNILNENIKLSYNTKNIPIFKGPLTIYETAMYNLGAETDNSGLIVGVSVGNDLRFGIEGRYIIERDAAYAGYASEITPMTNFNQLVIAISKKVTDNLSISTSLGLPQRIGPDEGWAYGEVIAELKF